MTRWPIAKLAVVLAVGVPALAPGAALADETTGGTTGGTAPTGTPTAPAPTAAPASDATLLGQPVRLSGRVDGLRRGRAVAVQRSDARQGWVTVARARARGQGRFAISWRPDRAGRLRLRAVAASGGRSAQSAGASELSPLTVYRPSRASWYGPGFYGKRTACGQTLTPDMVGVANRTLPCGTQVEIYYGGRVLQVPVIDRGPFANGADWDLTGAAAKALGFDGVASIGTLPVGG